MLAADHAPSWTTLLRACGADESFLRTYKGVVRPERVAEFLLLDRLFPRSVFNALLTAERSLSELDPQVARAGIDDPARRVVGRIRTQLEYVDSANLLANLPQHLIEVEEACLSAGQAIATRYFKYAPMLAWAHEEG